MNCTNEDFNYIDMRNWGLFIAFYSIRYSVDGIPNYGYSQPFFPGERRIVKFPLDAINLFFKTWIIVGPRTWKLIYQKYFWNSVKRCYIITGTVAMPRLDPIPCGMNNPCIPPTCCC